MKITTGETAQTSLIGDRRINQDRCNVVEVDGCTLLCLGDGMGGHPRGEMAAQILVETCEHYFHRAAHPIQSPFSFLTRMLHKAHESILAFGYDQQPVIDPRTTAVVALVQGDTAYWAHAGDSRLYLLRKNRVLKKTVDHSYVERLRQQGVISENELETHPQRNYVTRCLGGSISAPDITMGKMPLEAEDVILLCSDGLWGNSDDELISDVIFSAIPLSEAVHSLAEEATQKGYPESDNTTVIATRIRKLPPAPVAQIKPPAPPKQKKKDQNLADAIAELQSAIDRYESEK